VEVTESQDGVVLAVKVVPGASRTAIAGEYNGMLKIKLSAPPQKGKANQCLIEFLAKRLGVKKKSIRLLSGKNHPSKRVQISGVKAEEVISELMGSGK